MSGAGNDFVIFDARKTPISLTSEQIKKISDRKNIGCDQLIIMRPALFEKEGGSIATAIETVDFNNMNSALASPKSPVATRHPLFQRGLSYDVEMEIYNSDGSMSGACGNATRCVASLLEKPEVKIKTAAGILKCWRVNNLISVDMGAPKFAEDVTLHGLTFSRVDVGNPHAVTFIDQKISDEKFFDVGPKVETNKTFPNKTNVEFAQIISDDLIEVRVWERGAGETLACGSGACAVAVAAIKNNLVKNKKITIRFKGGDLQIEWNNDSIVMTGGYTKIFDGVIDEKFLG